MYRKICKYGVQRQKRRRSRIHKVKVMQAVQSCVLSSVEDPQQYKDLTSQNHQPRKQNKTHDKFLTKNQSDQSIQSKIGSESREWLVYLLLATWAMMIFMPETVAWRQKKAASKKHRHHASHNSCQAWLWSGIQTSKTINDQNQFQPSTITWTDTKISCAKRNPGIYLTWVSPELPQ